jgi:RNA polymerase sigma-70 factor, ECF subfamily
VSLSLPAKVSQTPAGYRPLGMGILLPAEGQAVTDEVIEGSVAGSAGSVAGSAGSVAGSDEFEAHRSHLMGVAYRMLGSRVEAEDAVQEAYLRFAGADRAVIRDVRAWLTTATGRICLDILRSARVRREAYVGPWLPEPVVTRMPDDTAGPDDTAVRREEVSLAMLLVLETLTPEQRVALVLHDAFAVPFDEIASLLGTSPAAARQLATRARRAVADGRPRHAATRTEQREVVGAFLAAAQGGDISRLVALLAPDVIAIGDGGGVLPAGRRPVEGALKVARFMAGLFRMTLRISTGGSGAGPASPAGSASPAGPASSGPASSSGPTSSAGPASSGGPELPAGWAAWLGDIKPGRLIVEEVLVNGDVGLLFEYGEPPIRLVMGFAVDDGRITGIFDQVNPAKLTAVPPADPERDLLGLH